MGNYSIKNKRGAALLTVLVALMLISLMTLELQYTSLVEKKLAYNDLNQIQAHYLAKSGVHLGLLRLILYGKAKNTYGADYNRYLNVIWSLPFPPYPPTGAALSKLSLQERSNQEDLLKKTKISNGQFSYTLSSESSKLNLNLLSSTSGGMTPNFRERPKDLVTYIGYSLLSRIERIFKESESPDEEFGNIKPEEVVYNIMDWISPGNTSFGASNKDSWYEQQVPPYKAKRANFFTLDEVKLVKGMSPALFEKLKPSITVFSDDGKTDLDVATTGNTLKQLYPDFTDKDIEEIQRHFQEMGQTWSTVDNFTNYMTARFSRFLDRYPAAVHKEFFTVGSESFLLKSQGVIKKSGSSIRSDIVVAVSLNSAAGGCPEIPGVTNVVDCTKRGGFLYEEAGKCFTEPSTPNACKSCKFTNGLPMANLTTPTQCQVFGASTKQPSKPYSINFTSAPTTTTAQARKLNFVKIYSWVES